MKKILEIIYSLLIGLIGDDISEEVTAALAELKKGIDELSDETKTDDEIKEVENRIQTQLNDLLPKMETTANKADLAKLKNQFAKFQESLLDEAVKNFKSSAPKKEKNKVKKAIAYAGGISSKLVNLITIDSDLIPEFIQTEVVSQVPENMDFMSELAFMGNHRSYVIPIDDYDGSEDERPARWAGAGAEKDGLIVSLTPRRLGTQPLYQLAGISWEELDINGGMLPKYRVTTTLKRWREEYMRAVVVGDGRTVGTARHITTLVPIKRDVTDAYCTVLTPGAAATVKSVRTAIVENVLKSFEAILVANAATINALQEISTTTGIVTYMSDEELAKILKVKRVVTNDYLADGEIAVFRDYKVIGVSGPSTISDYDIKTNTDWFEVIGMVGGDLGSPKSALFINAYEDGTLTADPDSIEFIAAGEAKTSTVTASSAYEVTAKPTWITPVIDGDTLTATAAVNAGAERSGSIVLGLIGDPSVTKVITVTQLTGA